MRSLKFTGSHPIAGTQQEYSTIHGKVVDEKTDEVVIIFELTDEELAEITRTKKLVYSQLRFGNRFQPMRISTQWHHGDVPEIESEINSDPKLN